MTNFTFTNDSIEPTKLSNSAGFGYVLPQLSDESIAMINPIVPPTSGIRMPIYQRDGDNFYMHSEMFYRFVRVFKAISCIGKTEIKKDNPNVFICSDDRPSGDALVEAAAKIFAFDGYNIFMQDSAKKKDSPYYSRMSAPYASATIALFDNIDLIIMITASHNELIWNGVKFYIELPIPISGRVMNDVSKMALSFTEVPILQEPKITYIDSNAKNNDYIIKLISKIIDINVLKGAKVLLWPYLGTAPEVQDVMKKLGIEVHLIDEDMEPPNPTENLDVNRVVSMMKNENIEIAILLDADRDRIVFIIKDSKSGQYINLSPNELYTSMHNILVKEFKKKLINVRTIPSDPRSDDSASILYSAGVGYKHLGMLLYLIMGEEIEWGKLKTGILYEKKPDGYHQIQTHEEIITALKAKNVIDKNVLSVLWEESGGHTFNIIDFETKDGVIKASSEFPLIGDKYPVPALLILTALVKMKYSLPEWVDQSILGTRTVIDADDKKKVEIINYFAERKGTEYEIKGRKYKIGTFETLEKEIDIILLKDKETEIYFRPSGTGPNVRIYIFGKKETYKQQLDDVKVYLEEKFLK